MKLGIALEDGIRLDRAQHLTHLIDCRVLDSIAIIEIDHLLNLRIGRPLARRPQDLGDLGAIRGRSVPVEERDEVADLSFGDVGRAPVSLLVAVDIEDIVLDLEEDAGEAAELARAIAERGRKLERLERGYERGR